MKAEWLQQLWFGNRVADYLAAAAILAGGIVFLRLFTMLLLSRLRAWAAKTETPVDDFLIERIEKTGVPVGYAGAAWVALNSLSMSRGLGRLVDTAGIVVLTLASILFLSALAQYYITVHLARKGDTTLEKGLRAALTLLKVAIWGAGLVFVLDNLGFRISTVIAGLGVGGIAVALAAQSILGDLFSYFTILLDRPFEIGDQISVGDAIGTVEHIGIRTTRLDAVGGEQLVMPNRELTGSRLRNFRRMARRRTIFKVGVTYETGIPRLREIPGMIDEVLRGVEDVTAERVHFKSYGDYALVFEVAWFLGDSDYKRFLDVQQEINYRIFEKFTEAGIAFAYPTQTLYVVPPGKG
jgi:small-conductance mechanosensitive channel